MTWVLFLRGVGGSRRLYRVLFSIGLLGTLQSYLREALNVIKCVRSPYKIRIGGKRD